MPVLALQPMADLEEGDARALMRAAMERAGVGTVVEFARFLGEDWIEPSPLRKLGKWQSGESAPNYEGTMMLLRVAGWLTDDAAAAAASVVPGRSSDDRLQSLEDRVDRQGKATARTLKGLEAQLEHIRALLEPPGQAATEDRG